MANRLTLDLEVREHKAVTWALNNIGSLLNRFLPAKLLVFLYYDLLGWVPFISYRVEGEDEWQVIRLGEVVHHLATDDTDTELNVGGLD